MKYNNAILQTNNLLHVTLHYYAKYQGQHGQHMHKPDHIYDRYGDAIALFAATIFTNNLICRNVAITKYMQNPEQFK